MLDTFLPSTRRALLDYDMGAHWPSDVFATAFLATGETLLVLALLELLWRWLAVRFLPAVYERHRGLVINPGE
jgi:hypothetical protein